ncbi:MAG TPA: hypothetical protein VG963_26890, partial [Polyangiaceae bacterium]|nr:hypothetical protein [Polyangiaceae bacterium]
MVLLLSGCAQQQIEFQSNGFNRAIESSTNEQLLLNIVRSSKNFPIFFTKLTEYTGANMVSADFQPKLPFGPKANASYDLGPTARFHPGVSSMKFADLNTDEALAGLSQDISFTVFDQYAKSSKPIMVLATIMFDGFEISAPVFDLMVARYQSFCAAHPTYVACEYVAYIKSRCGKETWVDSGGLRLLDNTKYGIFVEPVNKAGTACDYLRFQSFLTLLIFSGFTTETVDEEIPAKGTKAPGGAKGSKGGAGSAASAGSGDDTPKTRQVVQIRFAAPEVFKEYKAATKALAPFKRRPLKPLMRSAKGMIEFLGQLTALQNYAPEKYVPETLVGSNRVALFRVERGEASAKGAILTVRDPQDEIFSVPSPQLGSPTRDQSLVTLSVVSDMLNLSTRRSAFP